MIVDPKFKLTGISADREDESSETLQGHVSRLRGCSG